MVYAARSATLLGARKSLYKAAGRPKNAVADGRNPDSKTA
jgi:hypothetical protein